MTIFLDMDEVVADFKGYVKQLIGESCQSDGGRYPIDEWIKITRDLRLYSKLPVKEGANDLVEWCQNYCNIHSDNLFFLTALPRNNDVPLAAYDKVNWAAKYFPNIPVIIGPYSNDKWKHCKKGDILIDDRISNCDEWKNVGGYSFIYKNWPDCKVWMEETLNYKV